MVTFIGAGICVELPDRCIGWSCGIWPEISPADRPVFVILPVGFSVVVVVVVDVVVVVVVVVGMFKLICFGSEVADPSGFVAVHFYRWNNLDFLIIKYKNGYNDVDDIETLTT